MFKIIQKFFTVIVLASFIAQPMLSATCTCPPGACTCSLPAAPQENSKTVGESNQSEPTQEKPAETAPVAPVTDGQQEPAIPAQ